MKNEKIPLTVFVNQPKALFKLPKGAVYLFLDLKKKAGKNIKNLVAVLILEFKAL